MLELSFHEAIRSGDRDASLIYADWLEDNGRVAESALLRCGKWRLIPAGSFWMGGGGGQAGRKKVKIPHYFYLGTYPLTQGEWQSVMGSNPSWFSRTGGGKDKVQEISDSDLELFPVETVSWDDVQVFLQKLNAREQDSGAWVYRLPSEQEWEYSCRGGRPSKEESSFHFYLDTLSNDLSSTQANFGGNYPYRKGAKGPYLGRTSKVGSYKANNLGIYDMHGNVWEWTDTLEGSGRVVRGGSWLRDGGDCRASLRYSYTPAYRYYDLGCRLALVPVRQVT